MKLFRHLFVVAALAAPGVAHADAGDDARAFARELVTAVRTEDVRWLAAHTRYPLTVYPAPSGAGGKAKPIIVGDQSAFVSNFHFIFGDRLRAKVLAHKPDALVRKSQGFVIGDDPSILFDDVGASADGHLFRIRSISR